MKTLRKLQIVIASQNVHKIHELRSMLSTLPWLDVLSLMDFPNYHPSEEKGDSFQMIAIDKATNCAKALNMWALADDSGLVVPALGGEPGIYSSRYAGNHATDIDNRKKLLEKMHHLVDVDRNAYLTCALALASPDGLKKSVMATCEGIILQEDRKGGGFGYDSIFIKHDYHKTFAELKEDKNRISHRRKAFDKLLPTLESLALS